MNRRSLFVSIFWLAAVFTASEAFAAPLKIEGLNVDRTGSFTAAGLKFAVHHYGSDWALASQTDRFAAAPGFPKESADDWEMQGLLQPASGSAPLNLRQQLKPTRDGSGARVSLQAAHPQGLPTQALVMSIAIPVAAGADRPVVFDGPGGRTEFKLPAVLGGATLFERQGVSRLILPTPTGSLEIAGANLRVSLHDGRGYRVRQYGVRLYFTAASGTLRDSSLDFAITRFDRETAAFSSATIEAGPEWTAYDHLLGIAPGSVFDRSSRADAPAGRHGRVIVSPQGQLVFEGRPERRLRFWGVNLCFDVHFIEPAQSDVLAERLQRAGYNAVRFHLFDGSLVAPGDRADEIDRRKLDRLEYLFAALKRRGVYVLLSLYTYRTVLPAEIPEAQRRMRSEFQHLLPLSDRAFENWSRYARALLTHRNPYTNMTWAEDPALLGIGMLNEESFFVGGLAKRAPDIRALYEQAYERWRQRQPGATAGAPLQAAEFNRFLVEIKQAADARQMAFLRELGVKALISGDNTLDTEAQVFVRNAFDFVENHSYWNHPRFIGEPWTFPIGINHWSVVAADMWLPRELMPSRIFGKPYVVGEFGYVWPNAARSEGGLLMAAYAGLQGWDALFTFDYAANAADAFTPAPVKRGGAVFSLVTDPITMLSDRAGAYLFLHGGVEPAQGAVAYLADRRTAFNGGVGLPEKLPSSMSWLGLLTRVGTLPSEGADLAGIAQRTGIRAFANGASISPAVQAALGGRPTVPIAAGVEKGLVTAGVLPLRRDLQLFRSETGQIELSRDLATARLVTPFAESFVLPPRARVVGDRVTVDNGSVQSAVHVLAVDGQALADSRRLLVMHLTDSLNTGSRFTDAKRTQMDHPGRLPVLIRRGDARLALRLPGDATDAWQAWSVDASGRRLRQVPLQREAGTWLLQAQTAAEGGAVLAYELLRP